MFEPPNLEILIPCCSTWLLPGKTSISTGASSHHVNHLRYFLTCFCRKDLFCHSIGLAEISKEQSPCTGILQGLGYLYPPHCCYRFPGHDSMVERLLEAKAAVDAQGPSHPPPPSPRGEARPQNRSHPRMRSAAACRLGSHARGKAAGKPNGTKGRKTLRQFWCLKSRILEIVASQSPPWT